MRAEMAEAANKIDYRLFDNNLYINASTLTDFAATVAQVHKEVLVHAANTDTELTDAQAYALVGQQNLCMVLLALHEALILQVSTDKALLEG
jgi:hypothetical protein